MASHRRRAAIALVAASATLIVVAALAGREAITPFAGSSSSAPVIPVAAWPALTLRVAGKDAPDAGGDAFLIDAVAFRGGVLAVGYEMVGGRPAGHLWGSTDGADWADIVPDGVSLDGIAFRAIAIVGDQVLAIGEDRSPAAAPGPNGPGIPVVLRIR